MSSGAKRLSVLTRFRTIRDGSIDRANCAPAAIMCRARCYRISPRFPVPRRPKSLSARTNIVIERRAGAMYLCIRIARCSRIGYQRDRARNFSLSSPFIPSWILVLALTGNSMARHYQAKQQRSRFETLLGISSRQPLDASRDALARRRDACGLVLGSAWLAKNVLRIISEDIRPMGYGEDYTG